MLALLPIFEIPLLLLVIIVLFNVIIFVHELGHFLAARWRGLQVDRFQIWFGRPIWKKEIGGVIYGLGWIPAGGFVALPQMAPMDAIEGADAGTDAPRAPLPAIKPIDKIIVAFAGPLFSLLLALLSAAFVWKIGKPADFNPSTEIGFVRPGSPADIAGLKPGDRILEINQKPVHGFAGSLDSITESIILSRGDVITFKVQRQGETSPLLIQSGFQTEATHWYQRRGLREVGIESAGPAIVASVAKHSPAADAGIQPGDRVVSVDGKPIFSLLQFSHLLKQKQWQSVLVGIQSKDGSTREIPVTPEIPLRPAGLEPKIGILWDLMGDVDVRIVHPTPVSQVIDSLRMMWVTITSVASPSSNIGVDHLSGPVGIAKMQYRLLQTEDGWRRILAFMVIFNVNLAVLNMLPFPVLDGGHITLALLERLRGKPVQARPLEILQTVCALLLISLMVFITTKDIGDDLGRGGSGSTELVFPE